MTEVRAGNLGEYELRGSVAVITGGSNGIGAATARAPGRGRGHASLSATMTGPNGPSLAASLPGSGHIALRMPMEDSAALRAAAAEVAGEARPLRRAGELGRRPPARCRMPISKRWTTRSSTGCCHQRTRAVRHHPRLPAAAEGERRRDHRQHLLPGRRSPAPAAASSTAPRRRRSIRSGMSLARVLGLGDPRGVHLAFRGADRFRARPQPGDGGEAALASPLRTVTEADDVALAMMAAVTHLRLTTGSVILVDGGKHVSRSADR